MMEWNGMSLPCTNVARKNSNIVWKKYCLTSLCVEKLRNSVEKWVYFRFDTKSYTYVPFVYDNWSWHPKHTTYNCIKHEFEI